MEISHGDDDNCVMDTFLSAAGTTLSEAYPSGVCDDPKLATVTNCRELLLREHGLTCLYWFDGQNPRQKRLLQREDDVLPTLEAREIYIAHCRFWGRQMSQARLEGLALKSRGQNFIMPDAQICPPTYFYPSIALDFISDHYLPAALRPWKNGPKERLDGEYAGLYRKAAVRGREVICLFGIFLEHARNRENLGDYCLLLDRSIFTVMALGPVLRLGMPPVFGEFVRQSVLSITLYFYTHSSAIREDFYDLSSIYFDQLLESLAELSNHMPRLAAYTEDDNECFGAI